MKYGRNNKLILVSKEKKNYNLYAAPIKSLPDKKYNIDPKLVPSYYHDLIDEISLWIEIGLFEKETYSLTDSLFLLSNSRPLRNTLDVCRTSLMLVCEGK